MRRIALPLLAAALAAGPPVRAQEPLEETTFRGVDHFMWVVRDLDAAPAFLRDTLGFALVGSRNRMGSIENVLAWMPDDSYLEPLAPYNPESAWANAIDRWRQVHEGAWKIGFNAEPLDPLYERFVELGWTASEPGAGGFVAMDGRSGIADAMWRGLTLATPPGHYIFFWHLTDGWETMKRTVPDLDPTRATEHPNTAQGIRAAWVAVWDVEETLDRFARMGMPEAGAPFAVPHLRAEARRIALPSGDLVFLRPSSWDSPVSDFLLQRGENLMGVTLGVSDLDVARRVLARGFGEAMPEHRTADGRCALFVPAEKAHGVFLEWVGP